MVAAVAVAGALATQLESVSKFAERISGYVQSLTKATQDDLSSPIRDHIKFLGNNDVSNKELKEDIFFSVDQEDYERGIRYSLRFDIKISFKGNCSSPG
jgi:hypothetical protein